METNDINLFEFIELAIYFSSIAFIAGIIFQTFIVVRLNKPWTWGKLTFLLIASRVVSLGLTILIWKYWALPFEMMQGPVLIPSVIAEIIVSPLMLRLFRHRIFKKPSTLV
jgi:hypothetical protein